MTFLKKLFISAVLTITTFNLIAQNQFIADRVVANVGDKIILQSDVENQVIQLKAQGYQSRGDIKCEIFQELLVQKLLLIQAELDSIQVGANQVESELERRLIYFIRQIGSQEKLEEFYNKSIIEIKEDFRPLIREQILTQMMQSELVSGVKVSPKEIEKFYKKMPKDSIPMVNTQYKINQIVAYPPEDEESRAEAREKLLDIRKRIINGERFSTLAVLYSEDPGSARKGGELGFRTRDELDPEFAKAAFRLTDDGGVSRIVESEYGFHIIQLIAQQGNQVNVRHILIIPKVNVQQKIKARNKLDSVVTLIRNDSLSFTNAALRFSEDEKSRLNEGLMVNPQNSSTTFELDQLPRAEYNIVKDLEVGAISEPFETVDESGKPVFKIVKVAEKTDAHKANLEDDYEMIEEIAIMEKQQQKIDEWLEETKKNTYIRIDDSFMNCKFLENGWIKH
ncbi:MAG TPA: peptidylprolyl isomerase [Bacteroidales bacterium]|nr:peptidylprolyl isomerase [Bacteroidales bacterium]